jgi:hypothetical protein
VVANIYVLAIPHFFDVADIYINSNNLLGRFNSEVLLRTGYHVRGLYNGGRHIPYVLGHILATGPDEGIGLRMSINGTLALHPLNGCSGKGKGKLPRFR